MICGWLISGDPERPCVMKPGHKRRSHRDAKTKERERNWRTSSEVRARQREHYANDPEFRQRERERKSTPEKRQRRRDRYANDAEYRERVLTQKNERYANNPEVRERMLVQKREYGAANPLKIYLRNQRNQERARQARMEALNNVN